MKFILFGLLGFCALALILSGFMYHDRKPMRDFLAQVEHLRSEPEALRTLGPPGEVMYPGDEAEFVRSGYPCAAKPVTHHALVYYAPLIPQNNFSDEMLFLYVDADLTIGGYEVCGT